MDPLSVTTTTLHLAIWLTTLTILKFLISRKIQDQEEKKENAIKQAALEEMATSMDFRIKNLQLLTNNLITENSSKEQKFCESLKKLDYNLGILTMMVGEFQIMTENTKMKIENQEFLAKKVNAEIKKIKNYALKLSELTFESISEK